jgi:SNF2 family DNA or RNA helicase
MKTLWKHQQEAVDFALKQRDFAFLHGLGSGKTGTMITTLRYKFGEAGRVRKTLIISPLITLGNWGREFGEFSRIPGRDIIVLNKRTGGQKVKQFTDAVTGLTGALDRDKIIICNYEMMQNTAFVEAVLKWQPEILVLDEAHRVRNHKGKRARVVRQISMKCAHRYLMTGSPILNDCQDVFYPYLIMDQGKTFGDNYYAFQGKYFQDLNGGWKGNQNYFPDYAERPEMFPELQQKMYFYPDGTRKAHRILTKDCVDLPPLVRVKVPLTMGTEQAKVYKEMRDQYLTYVRDIKTKGMPLAVVANLAITKALRLQQIASGFVKAEDGQEYPIGEEHPRLDALRDILETTACPRVDPVKVIVWACFKHNHLEIAKLCQELKLEYRLLNGDVSAKDKEKNMQEFRELAHVKVMIANQQAGGIGVNLVEAPVAVYYSRNFSLEQDLQSEARNYRGGSNIHDKVTRIDLVMQDSIDELVASALAGKQNLAELILNLVEEGL